MKILFVILVLLTHQLSFATYTQTEKNIKENVVHIISLAICCDGNLKGQLLKAKPEEYLSLLQSAQIFAYTLGWKLYCNSNIQTFDDISHINNYLKDVSNCEDINMSKRFKKDIRTLLCAFNTSLKAEIKEKATLKPPESFLENDSGSIFFSIGRWREKLIHNAPPVHSGGDK